MIRSQISLLCLWFLFALSGTAGAGVVDDAEEVLTTVRGKGAVSRQVRSASKSANSRWTTQSEVSSPDAASKRRGSRRRSKTKGRLRTSKTGPGSDSQEALEGQGRSPRADRGGRGRAMNFAGLFLLVALVVAAVSYSHRSGESH